MKQYNYCLDFIKGIACIFVVFMHCEFPGIMGTVVQAISRFCVPLFFMVSGYFCYKSTNYHDNGSWLFNKKVIHILKITINASLFYLVFVIIQSLLFDNINWHITIGRICKFLLFNTPPIIAGQYWFLFALLYVYILYAIIERFGLLKYAYPIAAFMFLVYIIMAQGMHLVGISVPNMFYRNFLVEGFAFFMLGHWIHKNQSTLRISNHTLLFTIVITTLLCLLERYLLGRDFGVNIVTIPQVFCLFLYAVNNPQQHKSVIQEVGKRYSMYVYILHPFVWHVLEYIYEYYHLETNTPALYAMPILVLFISLLLSHIVYLGNAKLLTQRK
jgi:surface polysaccharide O-acyltransferase-like enzyme